MDIKRKIYNFINSTFTIDDFNRAIEIGDSEFNEFEDYADFGAFQRDVIKQMSESDVKKI